MLEIVYESGLKSSSSYAKPNSVRHGASLRPRDLESSIIRPYQGDVLAKVSAGMEFLQAGGSTAVLVLSPFVFL